MSDKQVFYIERKEEQVFIKGLTILTGAKVCSTTLDKLQFDEKELDQFNGLKYIYKPDVIPGVYGFYSSRLEAVTVAIDSLKRDEQYIQDLIFDLRLCLRDLKVEGKWLSGTTRLLFWKHFLTDTKRIIMGIMTEIGAISAAESAIAKHPPAHWMVTPERIYQLLLMRIKDVEGQLDEAKKERDSLRKEIQLLEIQAETDKMMIANWKRQATAEEEHGHWHREAIRLAEENKRIVLAYQQDDLK